MMIPKFGGEPLPLPPDCMPGDHKKAKLYLMVLRKALERGGWSGSQRRQIKDRYHRWAWRAEGRDAQFEQYGTFNRPPGSVPPTHLDYVVAQWRRRSPRVKKEDRAYAKGSAGLRKLIRVRREERLGARARGFKE